MEKKKDLNLSIYSENLIVDATLFQKYQMNFNKNYKAQELFERFQTFEKNIHKIIKFNTDSNRAYKLGLTKFTDMTLEELAEKYLDFGMKNKLG